MIKPLYLSKEIFELISLGSEISLHSIFNSSVNLKINNIIVNISNNEYILPPYGMVLKDEDFKTLKDTIEEEEINLSISNNIIYINGIKIDLVKVVERYESKIMLPNNKTEIDSIQQLVKRLIYCGKKNGFNIETGIIIRIILDEDNLKKENLSDSSILEFTAKLELLKNFFLHGDEDQILKYFIGRGMGLTPSGDDFLVGMVSVFSMYDVFKESILKIKEFILENKGIYTNDISEQFLMMATEDKFSISIIKLLEGLKAKELSNEAVDNVLNYGGTSGVDIILGIIFASQIMNRRNTNE